MKNVKVCKKEIIEFDPPFFSVVIPVYNRSECFARALFSVICQTYTHFEIIVVDDGSSLDEFAKILEFVFFFPDIDIRVICHSQNKNGSTARNTGIDNAFGKYICFLDSDDEWLPEKLNSVKYIIDKYGSKFIYHQFQVQDANNRGVVIPKEPIEKNDSFFDYIFLKNDGFGIATPTITVCTRLARDIRFNENLCYHQDWDFCNRLKKVYPEFYLLKEMLTIVHVSSCFSVSKSITFVKSWTFFKEQFANLKFETRLTVYSIFLLRRSIIDDRFTLWLSNPYAVFSILFRPINVFNSITRSIKEKQIDRRVQNCYDFNKSSGYKSLLIYGKNSYAKLLINKLSGLNVEAIIETNPTTNSFQNIPVFGVSVIPEVLINKVDCIILSTDKHAKIMKQQLRANNVKSKIYEL